MGEPLLRVPGIVRVEGGKRREVGRKGVRDGDARQGRRSVHRGRARRGRRSLRSGDERRG